MFRPKFLSIVMIWTGLVTSLSGCETALMKQNQVHLDDAAITTKVKESLSKDPILQKYTIDVSTLSGEVELRGHVDSLEDVYRAAKIVNHIDGVRFLLNDLSEK